MGKGERKRGRETSRCGCLSCTPNWGPGPQPRHVPWLEIKLATLWFAGWHSIHWATPARAIFHFVLCSYVYWWLMEVLKGRPMCISFHPIFVDKLKKDGDRRDLYGGRQLLFKSICKMSLEKVLKNNWQIKQKNHIITRNPSKWIWVKNYNQRGSVLLLPGKGGAASAEWPTPAWVRDLTARSRLTAKRWQV